MSKIRKSARGAKCLVRLPPAFNLSILRQRMETLEWRAFSYVLTAMQRIEVSNETKAII